jgi:hypothetical protein
MQRYWFVAAEPTLDAQFHPGPSRGETVGPTARRWRPEPRLPDSPPRSQRQTQRQELHRPVSGMRPARRRPPWNSSLDLCGRTPHVPLLGRLL